MVPKTLIPMANRPDSFMKFLLCINGLYLKRKEEKLLSREGNSLS
jgi:hypothetical protein